MSAFWGSFASRPPLGIHLWTLLGDFYRQAPHSTHHDFRAWLRHCCKLHSITSCTQWVQDQIQTGLAIRFNVLHTQQLHCTDNTPALGAAYIKSVLFSSFATDSSHLSSYVNCENLKPLLHHESEKRRHRSSSINQSINQSIFISGVSP